MLTDPCMSGHQFGVCPLLRLDPPPIFKPRGAAQKILDILNEENSAEGNDDDAKQKARVNSQMTAAALSDFLPHLVLVVSNAVWNI